MRGVEADAADPVDRDICCISFEASRDSDSPDIRASRAGERVRAILARDSCGTVGAGVADIFSICSAISDESVGPEVGGIYRGTETRFESGETLRDMSGCGWAG